MLFEEYFVRVVRSLEQESYVVDGPHCSGPPLFKSMRQALDLPPVQLFNVPMRHPSTDTFAERSARNLSVSRI